ncbi:MAG TPA: GIY-YIG nuclease family protein, partial [Patescibacteria group bacterium]|nr:GIY-YIG nuclease family protein [Patescibacteria group bacterium]
MKSKKYKKTYVGCSDNPNRRLVEHNSGKSSYTKRYMPWDILRTEKFETYLEARRKEKFYKTGVGRQELKKFFLTLPDHL